MSERAQQLAVMYREFIKSPVYDHIRTALGERADSTRRNASKNQTTAYGELRFADGLEVFETFCNAQATLDKKGAREK